MQKRLFRILLLVVCAFVVGGCAGMDSKERATTATAHYQLGVSYLNDNNIQPAFVEFQKAMELNPHDKEVLNAIGVIYLLKIEDYPKAVEYFQRAIRADRNFSEAYNNLGFAFEKTGKFSEAIEQYKLALANPQYRSAEKAFNNLGRALYRAGQYEKALDSYRDALKRFPNFHMPYYGLALCYNAMGKYDDAAITLKKAVELDPVYKGDREKAVREMREKKPLAKGDEEKDLTELLEIFNY